MGTSTNTQGPEPRHARRLTADVVFFSLKMPPLTQGSKDKVQSLPGVPCAYFEFVSLRMGTYSMRPVGVCSFYCPICTFDGATSRPQKKSHQVSPPRFRSPANHVQSRFERGQKKLLSILINRYPQSDFPNCIPGLCNEFVQHILGKPLLQARLCSRSVPSFKCCSSRPIRQPLLNFASFLRTHTE